MEIKGRFTKTVFKGNNGYTVAVFELDNRLEEEVIITGYLPEINSENMYILHGEYGEHPRYGMQFRVEAIEKDIMTDYESLIRYFSGPQFHGIGVRTATAMVDHFGTDIIRKLREDTGILDELRILNDKKKQAIIEGLKKDNDDMYFFLTSHHLSMKNIIKLENCYGEHLMEEVTANPYNMVRDIDGIGFITADKFALSIGFTADHPFRLRALVEYRMLEMCVASGDSYLDYDVFEEMVYRETGCDNLMYDDIVTDLINDRRIAMEENRVYHITQHDAERYIAGYLAQFPREPFEKADPQIIIDEIKKVEEEFGIQYQDKQKEAIEAFFENDFLIITGGPGTGKTTIIRGIAQLCRHLFPEYNITLCAPTGRAAKRLKELTDCDASTIHSLLVWDKESGRFAKNEDNPLGIDLLIIDEFSMVDQWVFYNLLKAGAYFRKIILIGDQDQLPSVGIGRVLADIMDAGLFTTVRLEKIYRQKEGSNIISLAYDIKHDMCDDVAYQDDIRFFEADSADVRRLVLSVVEHAINRFDYLENGFMNIQVLSPMHKGINGIDSLNMALQEKFNPPASDKRELQVGYRTFRENDKILQLKNQPDDDVFNGDVGILKEIIYAREDVNKQNRMIVDFDGITVEYTADTFVNITHAYCMSIHKAQGSEYQIVVLPIVREHGRMLYKRLLYTGVTRANTSLIMIGQKDAFLRGVRRREEHERKTTLRERIVSAFSKSVL